MCAEGTTYRDSESVKHYNDGITVNIQIQLSYLREGLHNLEGYKMLEKLGTGEFRAQRCWVDTPRHHFLFPGDQEGTRRAHCWATIMSKSGIRKMEPNSDVIPVTIAALGKPYIAAYLYAAHNLGLEEIADVLDIKQSSVSQYLSDVANQHR